MIPGFYPAALKILPPARRLRKQKAEKAKGPPNRRNEVLSDRPGE